MSRWKPIQGSRKGRSIRLLILSLLIVALISSEGLSAGEQEDNYGKDYVNKNCFKGNITFESIYNGTKSLNSSLLEWPNKEWCRHVVKSLISQANYTPYHFDPDAIEHEPPETVTIPPGSNPENMNSSKYVTGDEYTQHTVKINPSKRKPMPIGVLTEDLMERLSKAPNVPVKYNGTVMNYSELKEVYENKLEEEKKDSEYTGYGKSEEEVSKASENKSLEEASNTPKDEKVFELFPLNEWMFGDSTGNQEVSSAFQFLTEIQNLFLW